MYKFHSLTQTAQILDHNVVDLVLMMVILFTYFLFTTESDTGLDLFHAQAILLRLRM